MWQTPPLCLLVHGGDRYSEVIGRLPPPHPIPLHPAHLPHPPIFTNADCKHTIVKHADFKNVDFKNTNSNNADLKTNGEFKTRTLTKTAFSTSAREGGWAQPDGVRRTGGHGKEGWQGWT